MLLPPKEVEISPRSADWILRCRNLDYSRSSRGNCEYVNVDTKSPRKVLKSSTRASQIPFHSISYETHSSTSFRL